MPWYTWLVSFVVLGVLALELYFRRLLNRVHLVERTKERKDYPEVVPYISPTMIIYKLFAAGIRNAWNDLNSTPGLELFQKLKTPCMMYQYLFMGVPTLVVCHPEAVKQILTDKDGKYRKPATLSYDCDRVFSCGIAVVSGEEWYHQRSVLNPFFKAKKLRSLVPLFCETTHHFIDCLEEQRYVEEKKSFDPTDWIDRSALDAMGKGGFGTEFHATDRQNEEQVHHYKMVMDTIGFRLMRKFAWYRALPLKSNIETEKALCGWEAHIKQLIAEKRKVVGGKDYDPKTTDLLGMLLHDKAALSDEQLRHNVATFYMGGHETITGCTSMMLCMLQQHPEVQKKVQAEVDEVFQGRDPDFQSIKKLKYMEMVFKEVVRLYPPAFGAFRTTAEEDIIEGYHVGKGLFIVINMFAIHRLEEFWGPDANEFNPERWGPGKPKPLPGTYFPFGIGAHSCIGTNFADLEIKVMLSLLMQRYTVVADPTCTVPCQEQVTVALSLRPGHTLRLERRS